MKPELLRAKERLARNLSHLSSYCWPRVIQLDCWPSRELLAQIKDDVLVLAQRERKKTIVPVWKAVLLVDKREKTSAEKLRGQSHSSRSRPAIRCHQAFTKVRYPEPADLSWEWMVLDLPRAIHMLLYNTNYDADEGKRQDEDAHEDDYERNELTDGSSDPWRLA